MPSIVGAVKVVRVGADTIVNVGDVYQLSPTDMSKTSAGDGSLNTGDFLRIMSRTNSTNNYDPDVIDQVNF
ncbi:MULTISPECIES: spore germination protein [Clostridia]|uniref:spore germination protein n=1 Tax=Clostridia TaxID=186801 RepID=UPI000EA16D70|nr:MULTISPECIES: spore germination protein [Clostridia]NBJ69814.1 spore germination protein [Roseburia sp. 1XD42-34]RKI77887.1 spore germination protein [Clostridium sp. 1xD42-85]